MTNTTTTSTTNLFLLEVGGELFEERGHVERLSAIQSGTKKRSGDWKPKNRCARVC